MGIMGPPISPKPFFPHVSPRKSIHDHEIHAPNSPPPVKKCRSVLGECLRISVCATQGGRKYMEDRVHIHVERDIITQQLMWTYVAVYDGHGGAEASIFTREHLLTNITKQPGFTSFDDQTVLQAINDGFILTHNQMEEVVDRWPRTASGFRSTSGTTASVAFIMNGKVYSGHVGDSGIVIGYKQNDCANVPLMHRALTVDHKPDCPKELNRIENAGGRVLDKSGVMRVVWTRAARGFAGPIRRSTPQESIPFLAVARSLGDLWSYNADMKEYIVSPYPDLDVVELTPDHKCLVFGSDGLWNVIKPGFAVDIVYAHEWRETNSWDCLERPVHQNHSRHLTRFCLRSWGNMRADNVTTLTVIFDPLDSNLANDASCVVRTLRDSDIDSQLTSQPAAMIRVTPQLTQMLKTSPVELHYAGALDLTTLHAMNGSIPHSSKQGNIPGTSFHVDKEPAFSGPGFSRFTVDSSLDRHGMGRKLAAYNAGVRNEQMNNQRRIDQYFHSKHNKNKIHRPASTHNNSQNKCPTTDHSDSESMVKIRDDVKIVKKTKPRYRCKKHGLQCKKVQEMNDLYETNNNLKSTHVKSATLIESPPRQTTPNLVEDKLSLAEKRSLRSGVPNSPTVSPVKIVYKRSGLTSPRLTRSGVCLSPSKSAPSISVKQKKMHIPGATPGRIGSRSVGKLTYNIDNRGKVGDGSVRKSAHLFRVRKLKYCLRRNEKANKYELRSHELSGNETSGSNRTTQSTSALSVTPHSIKRTTTGIAMSASRIPNKALQNSPAKTRSHAAQTTGRKRKLASRRCSGGHIKKLRLWTSRITRSDEDNK